MNAESPTESESPLINKQLKITVLMGGIGEERDISIQSGNCVASALRQAGLNIVAADIRPDDMSALDDDEVAVFFVALHGKFGEDGRLQQILEDRSLVYTGTGPQASRLAFDKMASKKRFTEAGIPTPRALLFDARTAADQLEAQLLGLAQKYVVKPLRQGSTIGVTIVDHPKAALAAARECSDRFGDCMIEEYIPGREITVGILHGRPLPIIEISPKTGFYDYRAKYLDDRTEFLFDTIPDPALTTQIENAALDSFNSLGCRHFARVDFILRDDGTPYVLELNTIPGFTEHSLLPRAAARTGLSMSALCLTIIDAALKPNSGHKPLIKPMTDTRV
ncbi:MAG: D-alanine--D-alanine ligase family protein [Planctomycetota bacterium]|jgi:D-alanine-D-alanine ligase